MANRITEKLIARLVAPRTGNRIEYDSEISGFGVRITSSGVISFVLNYYVHGRERRYTIGRYPELTSTAARERVLQLRGRIRDGHDPLEEREQERVAPTVTELTKQYLERYAITHKRDSSLRNDRDMINGIICPRIGSLRVKAVGKRDIEALHASMKATPYRANRVLSLLSKMFNVAQEWGWISENPTHRVPRFHEDRRERWLTVDELHRFRAALDSYDDQNAANALRLLLLTGAREGEILKAEWDQFDLQRGVWTKPSHHTKQKRIEHTPLSNAALHLLRSMEPQKNGPLFPGKDGGSRVTLRRPWVQCCKAAGLVEVELTKGKRRKVVYKYRPTLRLHDLRHTYASHLVSSGMSLQVVGRLLGHTQAATTFRYAHVADEALREATNRFGSIFKEPEDNRDE